MKAITYKGYAAAVAFEPEDGVFAGRLLGINDVVGFHAESVAELQTAFHEAVDDYITTCAKAGKSPEKPYSGQIMVRVAPEVHAGAALAAQLAGKSLAKWTEEKLKAAAEAEAGTAVAF
ncbi:type II toxin-antitoxin system HicB family antitoxin [Phenylobacterium sp.]|jgi:predicted HicB family RNase H-like nuclease|uniref:type II toxin-antitoxin system HicB family antitoxin n=1 Tax=Phenylobacterium sp. TaxID=1871053 RepID=UPI002E3018F2|nr:type II toxin-antitoxin system HicB family antitoxin [Phenylobacterium sp.]HEX4712247.1 type II toxin-antitoxin system HicB family antitoxin [Phenylobacterium sp.]